MALLGAVSAAAETLRIATWHGDFSRKYPGILLRDLRSGQDPGLTASIEALAAINADIILLTKFDYDLEGHSLNALQDALASVGAAYPYRFSERPNRGLQTGQDLDADGRLGGPGDAQGYGWFSGQAGMALLSRWPVERTRDFTSLLWRDMAGALVTNDDTGLDVQRLSSTNHWHLTVQVPGQPLHLYAFSAGPPVFDGPDDRNGRRNHDETRLWTAAMADGRVPRSDFVVLGNANLDPLRGDGRGEAMQTLLQTPWLQDPLPGSHSVTWPKLGKMRVSYVLPAKNLRIKGAGRHPSVPDMGPHQLIWVDLARPRRSLHNHDPPKLR